MLEAEAGAELPTDTYTVTTPGGCHLYFRAPAGLTLRNTAGVLGWEDRPPWPYCGYVVAAGSKREEGYYQVTHRGSIAELSDWLARALTPAPRPAPRLPMQLSPHRTSAYAHAIVKGETHIVATAQTGARHRTLLKAARTLGRLIGGGELAEDDVRHALHDAAARHIGVEGCTAVEVAQTIDDGIAYGKQLPRRIAR